MIILALDSGLERTGYSVFKKDKTKALYIASGLITTSKRDTVELRLMQIYNELKKLIQQYKPGALIAEQLFFFKNQKTVIGVSQAQGVAILLAGQNKLKLEFLSPLQIKSIITGYGNADKKSVQKMLHLTLRLNGELKQDDQADAIACGLAYCYLNSKLI